MSDTGQAEAIAIKAKLEALGLAFEGGPADDEEIPHDWTGAIEAYRTYSFNDPVPLASGRGLGVGEKGQPYTLPFIVGHMGPTAESVRDLAAETGVELIDWAPNSPTSGAVKRTGGTSPYAVLNSEGKPSSWRKFSYLEVHINGSPDGV